MAEKLLSEDYEEPRCPLSTAQYKENGHIERIPVDRMIERLDYYLYKERDIPAAERHLLYWLTEAEALGDTHGRLTVINELMGFYRKEGRREEGYKYAALGVDAVTGGSLDGRVVAATTYINAATVYKTFEDSARAYPLFVRAREIYESELAPGDERLGGLYNNMALALSDLGRYDEACELYRLAINIMTEIEGGGIEAAISYLNMANAKEAKLGLEGAAELIDDDLACAEALLDADANRRDSYYAYVCERCAPTYRYYGYFAYADELFARARSIHEGA